MCKDRNHSPIFRGLPPVVIEVIKTYCFGAIQRLLWFRRKDGVTDGAALEEMLKATPGRLLLLQQPNYYGKYRGSGTPWAASSMRPALAHHGLQPMALAVMKTPAEYGADITVGDGQPLGMPLAFGGPLPGLHDSDGSHDQEASGPYWWWREADH